MWEKKTKNKTEPKEQHTFILVLLCLYLADPATSLASHSVLGTLFSCENSLFIQLWKKINISEFVLLPH